MLARGLGIKGVTKYSFYFISAKDKVTQRWPGEPGSPRDMIKESLCADEKIKVLTFAVIFFFSHTTRIQVFGGIILLLLFYCPFKWIILNAVSLGKGLRFKTTDFDVNILVVVIKMIKMLGDGIKIQNCLCRWKWWAHTPDCTGGFKEDMHSCRKQMWLSN